MNQYTKAPQRTEPVTLEYLLKNTKLMPNGCMEWQMGRDPKNYGYVYTNGKQYGTHRLVAIMVYGEPGAKMHTLHSCDNPPCINPDHLRWGTSKENMMEAQARGLMKQPDNSGSKHGMAKLTEADIPVIFELLAQGKTQREIGKIVGIESSTISLIRNGKRWAKASKPFLEGNK